MNFHSTKLIASGLRLTRCVSLTLLPILGSECLALTQPQRVGSARILVNDSGSESPAPRSQPYLALMMPPALQFQSAPPAIDPALRLAAGAPPRPGGAAEEIAAANLESVVPSSIAAPVTTAPAPVVVAEIPAASRPKVPAPHSPVSILPDDSHRDIRAEDVLPYFQYPGTPAGAPAPGVIPPSSATYRQR